MKGKEDDQEMNERMIETAEHYLEGPTKGNLTQSMIKAGYKPGYAKTNCEKVRRHKEFQRALEERRAEIKDYEQITVESIDKDFIKAQKKCEKANDRTNLVRVLENRAKHVGYYKEDNEQRAEQRELTAEQQAEAKRYAEWACREEARKRNIKLTEATG